MGSSATIALLPEAARAMNEVLGQVSESAWFDPSPCRGWRVGDVANHVVAEHLWVPHLLRGETLAQVGDRYSGDVLGVDPVSSWRRAMTSSLMAWAQADLGGQVHTGQGVIPVAEYAHQMLLDLVVHAWDIAAGAGVDYVPVDDAVEDSIAYEKPRISAQGIPGVFGPPSAYAGENRLGVLLAMTGRMPFRRG
ncbi:TIGR03086 family metal-binding protein [Austwickia chelonae]|uniref:TIGR03086 family metal-binding protein n=1 Tax=Austwickia chelonae TaxID=100225 RepID=UPI000E26F6CD|nr:TIGR03086 family metal-binding protein [Austwickia chelonae]